jgi:folate-binding protein YgfZ
MTHISDTQRVRANYDAVVQPGGVGLINQSGRAVLRLTGPDRQSFLQGMVSNDVSALTPGQGCHAAFLDTTGHLLADLTIHALPEALFIETDAACAARFAETLDKYLIMEDVEIHDVSREWAIFSVLGEGASAVHTQFGGWMMPDLPPRGNTLISLPNGTSGMLVRRPEDSPSGFDLWLPAASAADVRERLIESGAAPIGAETAEILRVEAGQPAWGQELNESILLPEADMTDAVSYTKGCYIGQEIVARLHARGHANRALRGFVLGHDAPVPHPGDTLHVPEDGPDAGREVGRITSAVASPKFEGRALCLAYIRKEYFAPGTSLDAQIGQPDGTVFSFAGTVLTRPFERAP